MQFILVRGLSFPTRERRSIRSHAEHGIEEGLKVTIINAKDSAQLDSFCGTLFLPDSEHVDQEVCFSPVVVVENVSCVEEDRLAHLLGKQAGG